MVILGRLRKIAAGFSPFSNLYAGFLGRASVQLNNRIAMVSFCSGAGLLITKATAKVTLMRLERYPRDLLDDIWLALTLSDFHRTSLSRFDITSLCKFDSPLLSLVAKHISESSEFHIRIKSDVNRKVIDPKIYEFLLARTMHLDHDS